MRGPLFLAPLVLWAAACGQRSSPIAPELVLPKPPADVIATAAPTGVELRWARPTQYTGGRRMRDLDGFVIERADDDGTTPTFNEVATIHLEDRFRFQQARRVEWLDTGAADGRRYLYRVSALTLDGDRSQPAGPIAIEYRRPATPKPAAISPPGVAQ